MTDFGLGDCTEDEMLDALRWHGLTKPEATMKDQCCADWLKIVSRFVWVLPFGKTLHERPYIRHGDDEIQVNYCPACGADVRGAKITSEQWQKSAVER